MPSPTSGYFSATTDASPKRHKVVIDRTRMILRTAGVNCDGETAHAFELAGSTTESIHLNRLLENPKTQERIAHMLQTGRPLRN